MCWSGEASAALATAGLGSTAYVVAKGEKKELWMPLGYFSLMELLQAFTYGYIDMCNEPMNHILTVLGFMHISFQPFFINAMSMYFIPQPFKKKIAPFAYTACFAGTILLLLKLYPFHAVATGWTQQCNIYTEPICATALCSMSGNWHIAWGIPFNSLNAYFYAVGYYFPAFIVPLLYGSWKITAYLFLFGPFLASFLTDNKNEWPAVWCLFSIGLLLIVIKTPVRKYLHVKNWYAWKYPSKE